MNKQKFRKLIQKPLKFHHQDIHDRLDKLDSIVVSQHIILSEIRDLLRAINERGND